ncbi:hypothetical protein ACFYYH_15600 [Streptomyces sp. NPDC002018]|uniref:hypothetical protein n=1 Tax=Streptomyces sp. NPDC002018 TaxID=3364629 RepID=UPI003699C0DB
MDWQNELWDGQYWLAYRSGSCSASQLNTGQWGVCNKDLYENTSINHYEGRGSKVRWRIVACTSIGEWSPWHANN